MKQNSVRQDDPKPKQLTQNFIVNLNNHISHVCGYFQLVEFHKKRQRIYSTHVSDGYFRCKVIFREQPSEQINLGQIKLFSILYGTIRNEGNRVLVVNEKLKAWEYMGTIGIIKSWSFSRVNLNLEGSNQIVWQGQRGEEQDYSQDGDVKQGPHSQQTQHRQNSSLKHPQPQNKNQPSVSLQSPVPLSSHPLTTRIPSQSHQSDPLNAQQNKKKLLLYSQQDTIITNEKQQDDDWDELSKLSRQIQATSHATDIKNYQITSLSNQHKMSVNEQSKLSEQSPQIQHQISTNKLTSLITQINIIDLDKSSQDQSSKQSSQSIKEYLLQITKMTDNIDYEHQLQINDLHIGSKYQSNQWIRIKPLSINNQVVIVRCSSGHIINIICDGVSNKFILFKWQKLYLLNIRIAEPKQPLYRTEIQLHLITKQSNQLKIQSLQIPSQTLPSQFPYIPLNKIITCNLNTLIHLIAIIKQTYISQLKNQNKYINKYTLLDVFTGDTIELIKFSKEKEDISINVPVIVLNCKISMFNKKRNLIFARDNLTTILVPKVQEEFFGYFSRMGELTPFMVRLLQWLKQGNSVHTICENTENYIETHCIASILNSQSTFSQFHLCTAKIVYINERHSYQACKQCYKKIEGQKCSACGVLQPSQIVNRYYIVANIGDRTGNVNILWGHQKCKQLLSSCNYEFDMLKEKYLFSNIELWIKKTVKGNMLQVAKWKQISIQDNIHNIKQHIKSIIKDIH